MKNQLSAFLRKNPVLKPLSVILPKNLLVKPAPLEKTLKALPNLSRKFYEKIPYKAQKFSDASGGKKVASSKLMSSKNFNNEQVHCLPIDQKAPFSTSSIVFEKEKLSDAINKLPEGAGKQQYKDDSKAHDTESSKSEQSSTKSYWSNILNLLALSSVGLFIYNFSTRNAGQIKKILKLADSKEDITSKEEIENKLSEYKKFAARDHTTMEKLQKANNGYAESILAQALNDPKMLKYFQSQSEIDGKSVTLESAIQLAHCCNSVITNKIYNMHHFKQVRYIIEQVQQILANNTELELQNIVNLSQHNNCKEVAARLQLKENKLVEYVILKYLHAKSYIAEYSLDKSKYHALPAKEQEKLKQEFIQIKNLSLHLVAEHKLLEHISSQRSGLNIIKEWEIAKAIEKGEIVTAKRLIFENIESYKQIRDDSSEYIIEYELGKAPKEQYKKPLNTDSMNILICERQLMKHYSLFATIAETEAEKAKYLSDFEQILSKTKGGKQNILDIIKDPSINHKEPAETMLNISSSLINFYKAGLNINKACGIIKDQLPELLYNYWAIKNIEDIKDELQLIEALIDAGSLAKKNCRLQAIEHYEQLVYLKLNSLLSKEDRVEKLAIAKDIEGIFAKRNKIHSIATNSETKLEYISECKLSHILTELLAIETSEADTEGLSDEIVEVVKNLYSELGTDSAICEPEAIALIGSTSSEE